MSKYTPKPYKEAPIHIDDIIIHLVAHHAHLSDHIDRCWDDPAQLVRLLPLYGQNATRLGRLLRARFALYGETYEPMETMAQRTAERYPDYDDDTPADDETLDDDDIPADDDPSDSGSHSLPIQIDDLIADMAAKQDRLFQYLDCCWQDPDTAHLDRLLAIYSQNANRLGRLLHDRYAIYGPPPNPCSVVLNQALDRLSEEWGIDL